MRHRRPAPAGEVRGIQRLPEGQPEEQPALRDIPFGQLAEVLQQGLLHGVAADPVELAQLGQVLAVGLAAEPLQRLPLPYPVGMQVGRLFQPQQVREQVRGGDQETDAQARQQGLRHRAGIDPAGLAQAADQRGCAALVEHQFAIGFVFDQGHAEFVEQRRPRRGVPRCSARRTDSGKSGSGRRRPACVAQALPQGQQVGALGTSGTVTQSAPNNWKACSAAR